VVSNVVVVAVEVARINRAGGFAAASFDFHEATGVLHPERGGGVGATALIGFSGLLILTSVPVYEPEVLIKSPLIGICVNAALEQINCGLWIVVRQKYGSEPVG